MKIWDSVYVCHELLEYVKSLKTQDAYVNVTNKHGSTPLHLASELGQKEVCEYLLQEGASVAVDAVDGDGDSPLHCAAVGGHIEIYQLLLDKSANEDLRNKRGNTALDELALHECGKGCFFRNSLYTLTSKSSIVIFAIVLSIVSYRAWKMF